ncbi:MAG: ABC transporter ATP-binding protein [Halodesulfurarchaeum sp.]
MSVEDTDSETQLSVRGLVKRFGSDFEISAVDLEVGTNEIVALLGPSGCGKTTILRCVAGVESPSRGEIVIGDDQVYGPGTSKPPEKRDVGMVYQNYAIWPHKTVYENVVFPLQHGYHDIPESEYEQRVENVLDLVEIGELKNSPATDLSGGQQQRTALARSLVYDPSLLLMDEPLSNLDRGLRKNMRYELKRLHHELDLSMLYVTHNQEEAFYLADRVLIMKDGNIVERGRPRELYQRPTSPFTRRFIGERNRFHGTIDETDDGTHMVRTPLVDFPLENADYIAADGSENGAVGTSVVCFIRPSDISIGRFGHDGPGVLQLTGSVLAEGVLGERYEVTVTFGDAQLIVHTESDRQFDRDDEISLYFPPGSIQVYAQDH